MGIGFGGTIGNERIFMDEDFARVTIRHHAVDKTYQPGSLVPDQVEPICSQIRYEANHHQLISGFYLPLNLKPLYASILVVLHDYDSGCFISDYMSRNMVCLDMKFEFFA